MAETMRTKNKIEATVDDIKVTPGVDPIMPISAMVACEPGDEVIVQSTMYGEFFDAINFVRAKPKYLDINQEDNWKFHMDLLNELVTERTRLIYLVNPNNPIGRVMTIEELRGIADIAVDNNLLVGVDEIYSDMRARNYIIVYIQGL